MIAAARTALRIGLPIVLLAGGCAATPGPIFPPISPAIVWPAPPEAPRIRYIGSLAGEASLGAVPDGWDALRAVLTGPTAKTPFVTPTAAAAVGERVYVTDPSAPGGPALHRLDLETREFRSVRLAGGRPLKWPIDVAVLDGRVAVADSQRASVLIFDAELVCLRELGAGSLKRPTSVAFAPDGDLWVVDTAEHALIRFDPAGQAMARIGGRGAAAGALNFPTGACVQNSPDAAWLCVADSMNFRCQRIAFDGSALAAWGKKGDAAGDFALPRDVAIDSDGHTYVLDSQFENVQIFDAVGRLLLAFGGEGGGAGRFSLPSGISIDAQDRIWIADTYNRRVQVFQYLAEAAP